MEVDTRNGDIVHYTLFRQLLCYYYATTMLLQLKFCYFLTSVMLLAIFIMPLKPKMDQIMPLTMLA